jgi:hypothetical protein
MEAEMRVTAATFVGLVALGHSVPNWSDPVAAAIVNAHANHWRERLAVSVRFDRLEDWCWKLISRLARLFREALDCVYYAVMLARCWAVDLVYGPEPPTPAVKKREADHERLQKAFPVVDLDRAMDVHEERRTQTGPTPITAPLSLRRVMSPLSTSRP